MKEGMLSQSDKALGDWLEEGLALRIVGFIVAWGNDRVAYEIWPKMARTTCMLADGLVAEGLTAWWLDGWWDVLVMHMLPTKWHQQYSMCWAAAREAWCRAHAEVRSTC